MDKRVFKDSDMLSHKNSTRYHGALPVDTVATSMPTSPAHDEDASTTCGTPCSNCSPTVMHVISARSANSADGGVVRRRPSDKSRAAYCAFCDTSPRTTQGDSPEPTPPSPTRADAAPGFQWKRGKLIGTGSYGSVYTALSQTRAAIFAVKESPIPNSGEEDIKFREKLQSELDICRSLRHPNIVNYLGHDWDNGRLYIYMEYMPAGSMAKVLKDFGPLAGGQLAKASAGLFAGLNYLHTRSPPVVHRDVKAANLLVSLHFDVKLADFGVSRSNSDTKSFSMVGSIPWMAPEVMLQEHGHGRKADIWSAGCTVIEMATGAQPWGSGAFDNVMYAIRHIGWSEATPPIPEAASQACQDLIAQCVQRRADDRPTADQLLHGEFLWGMWDEGHISPPLSPP